MDVNNITPNYNTPNLSFPYLGLTEIIGIIIFTIFVILKLMIYIRSKQGKDNKILKKVSNITELMSVLLISIATMSKTWIAPSYIGGTLDMSKVYVGIISIIIYWVLYLVTLKFKNNDNRIIAIASSVIYVLLVTIFVLLLLGLFIL